KGTGPAIVDTMGGHVEMAFAGIAALIQHVRSGKLRALGVTASQRVATLPDLPTIAEAGLPGYELTAWHGMVAPAGTPPAIVDRVHAAVVKSLDSPDVRERFTTLGAEVVG